jgi:sugar lactone lactonase YvrE
MNPPRIVLDGLGFPESTRWHAGRLWLCNWGSGQVLAVTSDGEPEVVAELALRTLPFSIDWLPDGDMLVVDGTQRLLLRQHVPGGPLEVVADLSGPGSAPLNELVVDSRGNAYVNGASGIVLLVRPDGTFQQVADGLQWPNGMALIDDGRTLVVADSHAEELVGYDVGPDGKLSAPRVWAGLQHPPDGICADADGAIWAASVPGRGCVRVREGGEVVGDISVDRGCFACMLGGEDGRTLFIGAAQWRGMDAAMTEGPGVTGQLLAASDQPAAHSGRP